MGMTGFLIFGMQFINFPVPLMNYNIDDKTVVLISSHHSEAENVWVRDNPVFSVASQGQHHQPRSAMTLSFPLWVCFLECPPL